jgi:hypothetical protein
MTLQYVERGTKSIRGKHGALIVNRRDGSLLSYQIANRK